MYLLAKFREPRACASLVKIISTPGETVFDLMGNVVTEDLGRIFAFVCGNDIGSIEALVEEEQTNKWVLSAAMDALVVLVAVGQRGRLAIREKFGGLLQRLERRPGYVWDALANSCANFRGNSKGVWRRLIDRGSIHPDDVQEGEGARQIEGARATAVPSYSH